MTEERSARPSSGSPRNPDKVVKPDWAAKVLSIDPADLPKLGRRWTKRDVNQLRTERPMWLTEARRRYAAKKSAMAEDEARRLDEALTARGWTDPDLGTMEQA